MTAVQIVVSIFCISVFLFAMLVKGREGTDIFADMVDALASGSLLLIIFGPLLYEDVSDIEVVWTIRNSGIIGLGACLIVRFLFSPYMRDYMKKKFGIKEDPQEPES